MRQRNGSALLGPDDPRSATIGIIDVAPNDDRENVLAAILTQEKLGRKQIAVVLPGQNRAFQRPGDFDGLKNLRRKLRADLVVVAPYGSSPAEFARQRQFSLFTSLENYGQSLRDESATARAEKRGWLPFRRQPKLQPIADTPARGEEQRPPTQPDQSQQRVPSPLDEEEDVTPEPHGVSRGDAATPGVGLGAGVAAGMAADEVMHSSEEEEEDHPSPPPTFMEHEDEEDALSLPATPPQVVDSTLAHEDAEPDEMVAPLAVNAASADEDEEPNIITFPIPPRAKTTRQLPPVAPAEEDEVDDEQDMSPPTWRQSSGAGAAVGAAAVGAGAGTAGGSAVAPVSPPPTRWNAGGPPPHRRRRWWLLIALLLLLLLCSSALCGGIALAAPGPLPAPLTPLTPIKNFMSNIIGTGTPSATVNITPKSSDVQNTYVISGVTTGTPDSSKRQVQARQLTFTTQPQSKTVSATGRGHIPATQATGTLTFFNALTFSQTVGSGTVFNVSGGFQIVTDTPAVIPAANPPTEGLVTIPAHAVPAGSGGNIGPFTINGSCCLSGVTVQNTSAFSGGQNQQDFTAVQQSDINNAANPLEGPLTQSAQKSLLAQEHSNEQFVNNPQCKPNVTSDHKVGDRATSVTVKVTVTCSGEVYDQSGARAIATNLLKDQASKTLGTDYALVGDLVTQVTQATADSKGMVTILVKAEGIWVFQFNDAKKAELARLIAGRPKKDARALLAGQDGVGQVGKIDVSNTSDDLLPTDPKQITIVVQNVPGLKATPTSGAGTPTPSPTRGSPVPRPTGSPPGK